jgi:hypothetical protein
MASFGAPALAIYAGLGRPPTNGEKRKDDGGQAPAIHERGECGMVVVWQAAARIRSKFTGLREIYARAIGSLLDDGQFAEITPDQWVEALIQAIADSLGATGCEGRPQRGAAGTGP